MISCDAIFQVGRQFTFSNGSITVNTGALIAAGALALLGLAALLFFLFSSQDSGDTGGSGYGYGYETQDSYGYGDSYAHSRSVSLFLISDLTSRHDGSFEI